jgi:hypothetical protein
MANTMSKQLRPDFGESDKADDKKDEQAAREGWSENNNGDLGNCGPDGSQRGPGQYVPDKGTKQD